MVVFQRSGIEIRFDPLKCLGCRSCELACAYRFFKALNPKGSGIRILSNPLGVDAKFCKQCSEPECLESCDMDAIYWAGGAVHIDYNSCTGCGACVKACPFGYMYWFEERGLPVKCDLCGGNSPACVQACPRGALEVVPRG